ncbi:MAG: class I SAM-dependent methyltransferase [Polyangiaceae bacterium]|jgi:23S rRNA (cytosine1962-C5)-methyltransferase|nr:class I SAM-dependent methyltransferase [Polyangiaceae bacterium]
MTQARARFPRIFSPARQGTPDPWLGSLFRAASARQALARREDTTAFRLAHAGELSSAEVAIDLYDQFAVAHFFSDRGPEQAPGIARRLCDLGVRGVYGKFRPRQANTLADTRRDEVAPARPLAGDDAPDPLIIHEGGDPFRVRLGDGLSTGIFLDQRANRALLRSLAPGRRVLNLFAYACAFSVSAARGGASSVVSVDISRAALAWGQENLALSGFNDPRRFRFIADEALTFLRRCAVRGDRYDLIALDPPSFASSKERRFTVEHDYRGLAAAALQALAPGGALLACTNHRGVSAARFRRFLSDAAADAGREIARFELLPPPEDFPEPPGSEPFLKAALLRTR